MIIWLYLISEIMGGKVLQLSAGQKKDLMFYFQDIQRLQTLSCNLKKKSIWCGILDENCLDTFFVCFSISVFQQGLFCFVLFFAKQLCVKTAMKY